MATFHSVDICGARLTWRQFVKTGGTLIVGLTTLGPELLKRPLEATAATLPRNTPNPALVSSWFEIHADNTMVIHTGKNDFGQSTVTTAYKQIVAEELNFPYDAITSVVMGDTDRTPDGGISAGLLNLGGGNLRKAAAYTQQALLELAAKTLDVSKGQLTAKEGVVSGGGKRITYGELVAGQELTLTIPVEGDLASVRGLRVTGNPPMKPGRPSVGGGCRQTPSWPTAYWPHPLGRVSRLRLSRGRHRIRAPTPPRCSGLSTSDLPRSRDRSLGHPCGGSRKS